MGDADREEVDARIAGAAPEVEKSRFSQLSPRHRAVLRLVYAHQTSKEIARELGIGDGTVKGYATEAVAILGVRNRRVAAIALHAHESPTKGEVPTGGFVRTPPGPPIIEREQIEPTWLGPLDPRNWKADNTYGLLSRLAWAVGLGIGVAVWFGSLANGYHVASELLFGSGNSSPRSLDR